jgi:cold shock CspA family protein
VLGIVQRFNNSRGYGCIGREDGTDIFVDYTQSQAGIQNFE